MLFCIFAGVLMTVSVVFKMRLKLLIISSVALCLSAISAFAAGPVRNEKRDIGFHVGTYVPMYNGIEPDAVVGITYTQYNNLGVGFKMGMQYAPSVVELRDNYGAPIAVAYRTRKRSTAERLEHGAYSAASTLWHDVWYQSDRIGQSMIAAALYSLFSQAEYYVGVTPGFILERHSGTSTSDIGGAEYVKEYTKRNGFMSMTLDAGMNLNYAIWKFDIKLMPAFHYNVTGNYKLMSTRIEKYDAGEYTYPTEVTNARWFFSFSGGLSFRF